MPSLTMQPQYTVQLSGKELAMILRTLPLIDESDVDRLAALALAESLHRQRASFVSALNEQMSKSE